MYCTGRVAAVKGGFGLLSRNVSPAATAEVANHQAAQREQELFLKYLCSCFIDRSSRQGEKWSVALFHTSLSGSLFHMAVNKARRPHSEPNWSYTEREWNIGILQRKPLRFDRFSAFRKVSATQTQTSPQSRAVRLISPFFLVFLRPRTGSWWNKWPPCRKAKSLTAQGARCCCPNNRPTSGQRHRAASVLKNTVTVSPPVFPPPHRHRHRLLYPIGKAGRPCRTWRSAVVESKKAFSKCQHILDIFWQLFSTGSWDVTLDGGRSPRF